ncbi:MAG: hypothetical protein NTX50_06595 [Candidatus Sumerlaeota bacterium]|nr:hypothetical protein [Candidatus Sumerlaeota bacterium]
MKTMDIEHTTLGACVSDAQHDRVILTHDGKPVALLVGMMDLDEEQIRLGQSDQFWKLIAQRRSQTTLSREQLLQRT